MNRTLAPNIKLISGINTHFPQSDTNLFKIKSEDGVFKLDIVFPNAGQVQGKNKFAIGMVLNLLMSGNEHQSSAKLAEEIDELGGFVFKSSDFYSAGITVFGLNEHIRKTIKIVKKAIDDVAFTADEIAVYKRNRLSELNINLEKTSYLASKGINELLCGKDHDISFRTTEEIIDNTTRQELIDFKAQYFTKPYFIFTGSETSRIEDILLENSLDINSFKYTAHKDKNPVRSTENLIITKESAQNSIRYGAIWPKRGHEDYFKLSLLNLILGGYFGSRLMKNIREDKGLTYGIHSSLTPYNDFSLFKISCEYNSQNTELLKYEIVNEIDRLNNELIGEEELTVAKNYLLGAMLRSFDGAFPISEKFKLFKDSNLTEDYYEQYFKAINSINADDIKTVSNNYLKENTLTYCIAGV